MLKIKKGSSLEPTFSMKISVFALHPIENLKCNLKVSFIPFKTEMPEKKAVDRLYIYGQSAPGGPFHSEFAEGEEVF
jgi:hypothetical protein